MWFMAEVNVNSILDSRILIILPLSVFLMLTKQQKTEKKITFGTSRITFVTSIGIHLFQ